MTHAPEIDRLRTDPPPGRVFGWLGRRGTVREPGWLGGVCAGVSRRIGVAAVLVRGFVVVGALFGFPMLLAYGLGWMLLPDRSGRILLRDFLHARLRAGVLGAIAVTVIGLLPWPLLVFVASVQSALSRGTTPLVLLVALAALASLVTLVFTVLIVRAMRRTRGTRPETARSAGAPAGASPPSADADAGSASAEGDLPDDAARSDGVATAPDDAATAQWRTQQELWREENARFRAENGDTGAAARPWHRARRAEERAAAIEESRAHPRARKARNPRASIGFVTLAIGVGAILGAVVAVSARQSFAAPLGLFVGAGVLAVSMIVAGALRRRSGALAFLTAVTLAGGVGAAVAPVAASVHIGWYSTAAGYGPVASAGEPIYQLWGDLHIFIPDRPQLTEPVVVYKRGGSTTIALAPGAAVELDLTIDPAQVTLASLEGRVSGNLLDVPDLRSVTLDDGRVRITGVIRTVSGYGPPGAASPRATPSTVVVEQESGSITLESETPIIFDTDHADAPADAPDDTSTDEEGS